MYILFGAGNYGKWTIDLLGKNKVAFFCDNKVTQSYKGIDVISFDELKELFEESSEYKVVITIESELYQKEVSDQLKKANIPFMLLKDVLSEEGIAEEKAKHLFELGFWENNFKNENGIFSNAFYKDIMLAIAEEEDDGFLKGKVVADFGCGPRGSLSWMESPICRIGIDVLTTRYLEEFGKGMLSHNMVYVASTETIIPIPNYYVDCLFSINSLDHVHRLEEMCEEIKRIIKPGGELIGSFNLYEPRTECEPQELTEEKMRMYLLNDFDIVSYKIAKMGDDDALYYMRNGKIIDSSDGTFPCVLWVRAIKKG